MEFQIPMTNWIWIPGWDQMDQEICHLVYFRKTFVLDEVPESRKIRVSADTRYKLWVNGQLAEVGPVKGDRLVWYVDEVELSPYLAAGENVIAAEVLRYPLPHKKGNHGMFRTTMPGLYVAEVLSEEERQKSFGPMADLVTKRDYPIVREDQGHGISGGSSWKCREEKGFTIVSESPFFAPLQILEDRTGDADTAGWRTAGYDDSGWQAAAPYTMFDVSQAVSPGSLTPRTIPSILGEKRSFEGLFGRQENVSGTGAGAFGTGTNASGTAVDAPETGASAFGTGANASGTAASMSGAAADMSGTFGRADEWNAMLAGCGTVTVAPHSHETVEISAGELMTGYLSLSLCGGRGAAVSLLTSECYVQREEKAAEGDHALAGLRHPKKKDRTDWENGYLHGFTDTYHVAGCGTRERPECYEPFWFRTFRFIGLEITTGEEPLVIGGFDYRETGYPLLAKTNVTVSDETLAPVWDISLRTLRRCMHETYEDCPFYEQLQYAMDSRSQILYTYAVSADDRLAKKCMDDFRRSVKEDGMTNCSYPCYGPNIIPGFSIYYIMMLYDHMMYFGDRAFLRQHMGTVDGILEFFDRNLDERGMVGKVGGMNGASRYWSFIDWTTQWDATTGVPSAIRKGPITMESLLYIMGLTHAAEVMRYLGRGGVAEEYLSRADAVRKAVQRYCVDENGMLTDGPGVAEYSQHCQVFALLTDTVSVETGRENLRRTLGNGAEYAQCSVAMAFYLFRALEKADLYDQTKDAWDLWRNMVKNNLTTCVEDGVNERSDCHAWGALALYELPSVVLGVRPASPGYETIAITPHPGYMTAAKGEVITPRGMVKAEWKLDEQGELQLTYEAPEGVEVVTAADGRGTTKAE